MAHFAELDQNNIVIRVCVVDDAHEADGENWCANFWGGTWKQTSYNGNMRKNFAGVSYSYDAARDAFIPPQPYPSWTLNEMTCLWEPPQPHPSDGGSYKWSEQDLSWVLA